MELFALTLLGVAMALDAFGIAVCVGMTGNLKRSQKILLALSFGFFQFFFAFMGATLGVFFNFYIVAMPKLIGGIVILILGFIMIRESFNKSGGQRGFKNHMYILLGASVSIDALVIGFTVFSHGIDMIYIFKECLYVGVINFSLVILALLCAKYLKRINIIEKYADFIGGIVLILFGLKMILL